MLADWSMLPEQLGVLAFSGYSPAQMHCLMMNPLTEACPVRFRDLDADVCKGVPYFNLVKAMLSYIDAAGAIKLTAAGYLPPKMVKAVYGEGHLKEGAIEKEITKLTKEMDSLLIRTARIQIHLGKWIYKRHNTIRLTKLGKKMLADDTLFLRELIRVYTAKFNWAYNDRYESEHTGRFGFAYSIALLARFGQIERDANFYAGKYFQAMPLLVDDFPRK